MFDGVAIVAEELWSDATKDIWNRNQCIGVLGGMLMRARTIMRRSTEVEALGIMTVMELEELARRKNWDGVHFFPFLPHPNHFGPLGCWLGRTDFGTPTILFPTCWTAL